MEKNSTSRVALLPRAANLATLGVVVAATWWSGAQRPVGQPVLAASDAVRAVEVVDVPPLRQSAVLAATSAAAVPAPGAVGTWPAQAATTIAREGLQVVGYQPRSHR